MEGEGGGEEETGRNQRQGETGQTGADNERRDRTEGRDRETEGRETGGRLKSEGRKNGRDGLSEINYHE